MKRKGDNVHGWINLNKPVGLTSTQAMAKVRKALNAKKAGHAGTLDPLADGILPIALGEATKTIPYIQDREKTYKFTVVWGEQRSTDDAEGDVIERSDKRPARKDVQTLLPRFTGEIEQTPPRFSAIKIDGQRAYDLARKDQVFEIKTRTVHIHSFVILNDETESQTMEKTTFEVTCGKGTYIRSLARDMGHILGCFGYVSALQRTSVGRFRLENAISLDKLEGIEHIADRLQCVTPVDTGLDDIPALDLRQDEANKLRHGQVLAFISKPDFERLQDLGLQERAEPIAMAYIGNKPLGFVEIDGPKVKPKKLFNI